MEYSKKKKFTKSYDINNILPLVVTNGVATTEIFNFILCSAQAPAYVFPNPADVPEDIAEIIEWKFYYGKFSTCFTG